MIYNTPSGKNLPGWTFSHFFGWLTLEEKCPIYPSILSCFTTPTLPSPPLKALISARVSTHHSSHRHWFHRHHERRHPAPSTHRRQPVATLASPTAALRGRHSPAVLCNWRIWNSKIAFQILILFGQILKKY